MKISLNGVDLPKTAEGTTTVDTVLRQLQSDAHLASKVLTKVKIDGSALLEGWQRRRQLSMPVSAVERLEITVEEPDNVVAGMLADAAQLLDNLVAQSRDLSKKFRIGDEVTANQDLAAYLENLKLVAAGLDTVTRRADNKSSHSDLRKMAEAQAGSLLPLLDRVLQAQSNGDYIAIADEIEYEFPAQLAEWRELVDASSKALNPA